MEQQYYCPTCLGKLERLAGCGAVGYFCDHCKNLVSRSKMMNFEEMEKVSNQGIEITPEDESVEPAE